MKYRSFFRFATIMFKLMTLTGLYPLLQSGTPSILILEESFESGGFSASAGWSGNLSHFSIVQEKGNKILRLNSQSGTSRTQIRLPSDAAYGHWEFYFRQNFSASNLNRSFIFLIADRNDLNYLDGSEVNGYALRTGENGDPKKLRLVRFDNGNPTVILDTDTILQEGTGYRVRVDRTQDGEWTIRASTGYDSQPNMSVGKVTDSTYNQSNYFGLFLRYTNANRKNFYFDDFRIISTPVPLKPESVRTVDPKMLEIDFSRPPDPGRLSEQAFHFSSGIKPFRAELTGIQTVTLIFSDYIQGGHDFLRIDGICDMNQICTDTEKKMPVLIASKAKPQDVIINEIMYDPIRPSPDLYPGQSEYIELFNRRPYALSLEGLHIRDHEDLHPGVNILEPVTENTPWIPGGGYLLLYPEPDASGFGSSRVARFFNLQGSIAEFTVRFDRTTLSLPSSGRKIILSGYNGLILDKVDYRPEWHNPNIIDTRGISLERVDPDNSSQFPDNWSSSIIPEGGTPGSRNSIIQQPEERPVDIGLSFEPNPFSPDGDGINDHLFIHYHLDQQDYMMRVRIYDRYGRIVRNLVNNQPAGVEGTLIWDGRRDNGQSNRIGIYIVYFEAYNSANGQGLRFKETVVLARNF